MKKIKTYDDNFKARVAYPIVEEVVDKYLDCGNPKFGFARLKFSDCGREKLLMFSCTDPLHPPIIENEVSFVPSRGWAEWMMQLLRGGKCDKIE